MMVHGGKRLQILSDVLCGLMCVSSNGGGEINSSPIMLHVFFVLLAKFYLSSTRTGIELKCRVIRRG